MRISSAVWKYNLSPGRVAHLDSAPSSDDLLDEVVREIRANADRTEFCWQPGKSMVGCFRVGASMPCTAPVYDWLFNGPTGYRAQYYNSEQDGEAFDRALVDGAAALLINSISWPDFDASTGDLGKLSLRGFQSKLGFDDKAFKGAPPRELLIDRWVKNTGGADVMNVRAPRPEKPVLTFWGTWVRAATQRCEFDESKKDRATDVRLRGYA